MRAKALLESFSLQRSVRFWNRSALADDRWPKSKTQHSDAKLPFVEVESIEGRYINRKVSVAS